MRSMTGFGVGAAAYGGGRVVLEARSVNHRYLDVRVRLPTEIGDQGFFLEQLARERLERGRFDITVQLEGQTTRLGLDRDRVRALFEELGSLRDELAPGTELPITVLGAFGQWVGTASPHDVEALRAALTGALEAALAALSAMRAREGAELGADLAARLAAISTLAETIADRAPAVAGAQARRLRERVSKLIEGTGATLDPSRLETEIALLADRGDVSEEVVRLRSHVQQAQALLDAPVPVGKRLDFLVQEMGREANTIGAKSQDAQSSHLSVDLRAELNRVREQVQNVE